MSTIQHINSVIDHFWPEYQRRFPAFEKPQIVPAETRRGMAPMYMRRNIDQDPTSFYMFVKANPLAGDSSRGAMKEFVSDLFYEKLGMASSYADEGLTPEQAVDKEVLPAENDREYQRFYDEQIAAAEAQQAAAEKQARADKLGFDPDDPDIVDVDDSGNVLAPGQRASTTAVGQAQTTQLAMPKQIWYAVDFHCPSSGMLGYNGGGRLNRRHGPRGYLREDEGASSDKADIKAAFKWAKEQGICDGVIQVAKAKSSASGQYMDLFAKYNLYIFKRADGTYAWVEQSLSTKKFSSALKNMSQKTAGAMAKHYKVEQLVVMTSDELNSEVNESRHEMKLRHDKMLAECRTRQRMFSKMLEEACRR